MKLLHIEESSEYTSVTDSASGAMNCALLNMESVTRTCRLLAVK
jgi:hypothetical protein